MIRRDPATLNAVQTKLFIRGHNATLDSSPSSKTIINTGGVTVVDAPGGHPYARAAGYFNGSSFLDCTASTDFDIGASDFTIRGWFNFVGTGNAALVSKWKGTTNQRSFMFEYNAGLLYFSYSTAGTDSPYVQSSAFTPTVGTWYFLQVTKTGGRIYFYVNGVATGDAANTSTFFSTGSKLLVCGVADAAQGDFIACDVEVAVGIARSSTVSTSPIVADSYTKLLLPMGKYLTPTTFADISPSPKAITRNGNAIQSMLPPGKKKLSFVSASSQFLKSDDSLDFFWPWDYTVDMYFKATSIGAYQPLFCQENETTYYPAIILEINTTGYVRAVVRKASGGNADVFDITAASSPIVAGVYYHIAMVRRGTALNVYLNGVSIISTTQTPAAEDANSPLVIGARRSVIQYFNGKISCFRATKGLARWTKNFIPPVKY